MLLLITEFSRKLVTSKLLITEFDYISLYIIQIENRIIFHVLVKQVLVSDKSDRLSLKITVFSYIADSRCIKKSFIFDAIEIKLYRISLENPKSRFILGKFPALWSYGCVKVGIHWNSILLKTNALCRSLNKIACTLFLPLFPCVIFRAFLFMCCFR